MAPCHGNFAMCSTPVFDATMVEIGIFNKIVIIIPIHPLVSPIIKVSALNTRETSFLLAPMLLKIPISYVRSNTEIYVMIPIIMEDTTKEMETNPIST